eukprot:CAMPEP_0201285564 /NCGR_PEP_ID=MMETSP1317-20130820/112040_1 /ASSEMBLY_ACC=CAM_ASM_000770 /TAXON_ID=187299 /ORGANISM="Undescribed Undescribed, Strain Undescribed" /LENGTH=63 /DNA_ID=CAMNT_0047610983 /DNA_START=215 /DNA_END=406 /DNA_ORIENTATION=-
MNSAWVCGKVRYYNTVDVAVAVETERGMLTPIIFDADTKGLMAIAVETKKLALLAKEGILKPE